MAEIKLTKNELRAQQNRLQQLEKYLPTLQLKKAMLQSEVAEARLEIIECEGSFNKIRSQVEGYGALFTDTLPFDIRDSAKILKVNRRYENIAGVEVPYFEGMEFAKFTYDLFDTPPWIDAAITGMRSLASAQTRTMIAREKKTALEKELRDVSIRVNLFEKILIPRSLRNIKKIKVFLGDQQLAAVSQAKVAKAKIEERKHAATAE